MNVSIDQICSGIANDRVLTGSAQQALYTQNSEVNFSLFIYRSVLKGFLLTH